MMRSARLLGPRAFEKPTQGETKWCANCTQRVHCHKRVDCSQCGREYRTCSIGPTATGFSDCRDHGKNGGWK